jgi:hypothetical protein
MRKLMRALTVLLCIAALASPLIGDTLQGPGPFNPNDFYFYWNMQEINTPFPPVVLSSLGGDYPYHCYVTLNQVVGYPPGFNLTCTAIAKASLTQRTDLAGGTITGGCTQVVNDSISSDNESAYYGEIDGHVSMTVPVYSEDFEATTVCNATTGCLETNNGAPRSQLCGDVPPAN